MHNKELPSIIGQEVRDPRTREFYRIKLFAYLETLMGLEHARDVATALAETKWGRRMSNWLNEDVVDRLNLLLPQDVNIRADFFSSPQAVITLRRLADPKDRVNFIAEELHLLRPLYLESLAVRWNGFLDITKDPAAFGWLDNDRQNAIKLVNGLRSGTNRYRGFVNPGCEEMMASLTWQEVVFLSSVIDLELIFAAPQVVKILNRLDSSSWSWSQKLSKLGEVLYRLGYLGPDNDRITGAIVDGYKKNLSDRVATVDNLLVPQQRRLVDELNILRTGLASGFARQQETLASIRSSHRGQLGAIRAKLLVAGEGKPMPEYMAKYRRRLERLSIDWREDWRHPTADLRATLGYEIEFAKPPEILKSVYVLAEYLGFKAGLGGSGDNLKETSPGPFRDYRTAQETFALWQRAGLIDLYQEYGQSVHLNIGLRFGDGVMAYQRCLQLTGDAYLPEFISDRTLNFGPQPNTDYHELRVLYNNQNRGDGVYVESKEFYLTTPRSFMRFLGQSALLGAALKNYHHCYLLAYPNALRSLNPTNSPNSNRSLADDFHNYPLTQAQAAVDRASTGKYAKLLAQAWLDYYGYVVNGLQLVGLDGFLLPRVPTATAARAVGEIRTVYPSSWSRCEVKPSRVESLPFEYLGRHFANPIHFVQQATWDSCRQIKLIMQIAENDYRLRLQNLVKVNFKDKLSLRRMAVDFPIVGILPNEQEDNELKEHLRMMAQLYGLD